MASPSRSFFDSVKGKLSRRSSNHSTKSNKSSRGTSSNPFSNPAPTSLSVPATDNLGSSGGSNAAAPPPSYTEATSGPTINVHAPTSGARGASPAPSAASRFSVNSMTNAEDQFAFLSTFDTIFLIDDSGSMAGRSWREVREALAAITPICTARDADGIDVYFLNAFNSQDPSGGWKNIRSNDDVNRLFSQVRPSGGTPTGQRLNQIMKPYMRLYEQRVKDNGGDPDNSGLKPINMIVITDGVPTDDPESVIVSIASKLDKLEAPPYQVGIQFFQVGNEQGAAEALQELDDALGDVSAGIRDIVDTVTWNNRSERTLSANGILKVVLGAVVRRLDRRRTSGESSRRPNNGRGNERLRP